MQAEQQQDANNNIARIRQVLIAEEDEEDFGSDEYYDEEEFEYDEESDSSESNSSEREDELDI